MKVRPITLRIPDELYRRFKKLVDRDGMKVMAAGAQAVELWVKSKEQKPVEERPNA